MTLNKTKNFLSALKPSVPKMLQNNVVYKINCPRCNSSYVGQMTRHLQHRFREHVLNNCPVKSHFLTCNITPSENDVSIIGRAGIVEGRLLTLEALYIKELSPILNTKDEYRSRTLSLKF